MSLPVFHFTGYGPRLLSLAAGVYNRASKERLIKSVDECLKAGRVVDRLNQGFPIVRRLHAGCPMERALEFIVNHYILVSIFAVLLVALILLETRRGGKKVTAQSAITLINRDEAIVVDIRDRKDFAEGHIVGSIHIPLSALKDRHGELKKHKDKQIIVADKMGQHAAAAVKQLNADGYENVVRLAGGIAEWKGSNLPLKKK